MNCTVINYYGQQTSSKCGYCKGLNCSKSHAMHAYNMSPQDYQDLIDRGWRRSGHYCYKPYNRDTCCPCYTIKCDALEYKLSKSHKKILKRMNRFLRDGKKDRTEDDASKKACLANDVDDGLDIQDEPKGPNVALHEINLESIVVTKSVLQRSDDLLYSKKQANNPTLKDAPHLECIDNIASSPIASTSSAGESRKSFDGQNPPRKKAKQMRLERRQAKLAAKGITEATAEKTPAAKKEKTLSDFVNEASPSDKHKLKIVLLPSNKQSVTAEAFNLYRKYQLVVHNDCPARLNPTNLQRFCYKSPLQYTKTDNGPASGYGSFHQQYWLDDKLIAIGVIDILPACVSSVYFFYDPDYSFLSLGTYGSLRELELVQQIATNVPTLKNYYMGFYIHSCPKMRYKAKLYPSYLLCPEAYSWHLITDEVCRKLNEHKYQRLNIDPKATDDNDFQTHHLDFVPLLAENNTCITYRQYIQSFNIKTIDNMLDILRSRIYKEITGDDDDRELILEYGKLVGKTCAHRILYLKI